MKMLYMLKKAFGSLFFLLIYLTQTLLLAVQLNYSICSLSPDQKTKQWRLKVLTLSVSYIVIPDGQ